MKMSCTVNVLKRKCIRSQTASDDESVSGKFRQDPTIKNRKRRCEVSTVPPDGVDARKIMQHTCMQENNKSCHSS